LGKPVLHQLLEPLASQVQIHVASLAGHRSLRVLDQLCQVRCASKCKDVGDARVIREVVQRLTEGTVRQASEDCSE
jgi:hypothetical protein